MDLKIIVDVREIGTNVVKKLYKLGVKIESKKLEVGDFILSERVCVEKKTVRDFLQSLIDGRLFEQVKNLVENFEKPLIIVEGDRNMYTERMIHPNAIRGAIAALAIDFRVPIIQTISEEETALFLYSIASREQIDKKISISLHGKKKPILDEYLQEYVVSSLPGIGREIARNLLKHFKTIRNLFNADVDELKKVKNVGKKKAERIVSIITKKYESHNRD